MHAHEHRRARIDWCGHAAGSKLPEAAAPKPAHPSLPPGLATSAPGLEAETPDGDPVESASHLRAQLASWSAPRHSMGLAALGTRICAGIQWAALSVPALRCSVGPPYPRGLTPTFGPCGTIALPQHPRITLRAINHTHSQRRAGVRARIPTNNRSTCSPAAVPPAQRNAPPPRRCRCQCV